MKADWKKKLSGVSIVEVLVATVMLTSLLQLTSTSGIRFSRNLKNNSTIDAFLMEHQNLVSLYSQLRAESAKTSMYCSGHPYTRFDLESGACVRNLTGEDPPNRLPDDFPPAINTRQARFDLSQRLWEWVSASQDENELSEEFFLEEIRPLLITAQCNSCHPAYLTSAGIQPVANRAIILTQLGSRFISRFVQLPALTRQSGDTTHQITLRALGEQINPDDNGPKIIRTVTEESKNAFCSFACDAGEVGLPDSCVSNVLSVVNRPPISCGKNCWVAQPPDITYQNSYQCQSIGGLGGTTSGYRVSDHAGNAGCSCPANEVFWSRCNSVCVNKQAAVFDQYGNLTQPEKCLLANFNWQCAFIETPEGADTSLIQFQVNSSQIDTLTGRAREQKTSGVLR